MPRPVVVPNCWYAEVEPPAGVAVAAATVHLPLISVGWLADEPRLILAPPFDASVQGMSVSEPIACMVTGPPVADETISQPFTDEATALTLSAGLVVPCRPTASALAFCAVIVMGASKVYPVDAPANV